MLPCSSAQLLKEETPIRFIPTMARRGNPPCFSHLTGGHRVWRRSLRFPRSCLAQMCMRSSPLPPPPRCAPTSRLDRAYNVLVGAASWYRLTYGASDFELRARCPSPCGCLVASGGGCLHALTLALGKWLLHSFIGALRDLLDPFNLVAHWCLYYPSDCCSGYFFFAYY